MIVITQQLAPIPSAETKGILATLASGNDQLLFGHEDFLYVTRTCNTYVFIYLRSAYVTAS